MKKNILSLFAALAATMFGYAQDWSVTFDGADGLPGVKGQHLGSTYYSFESELLNPGSEVDKLRLTVLETLTMERPSGNAATFALSELIVLDANGNTVSYTASSNADHNTLSGTNDGGGLPALNDGNYSTYFHSMWGAPPVAENHYIELQLSRSLSSFKIRWATRLDIIKNAPMIATISIGTGEAVPEDNSGFALGDAATTLQDLATERQLFVLKSNAVASFTSASGATYSGSGPIYMTSAERGNIVASSSHLMQLIPVENSRYIIYWPMSGKFLANSAGNYNGLNGWQYSTTDFMQAALVKLTPNGNGDFEIEYDGANSSGDLLLYVGAEMRDGVSSKMKIFNLEHKQYLENGDYTQGYSLPIAFNWTVYKANVNDETFTELYVEFPQLAANYLRPLINKATTYLSRYGSHEGACLNGEDTTLRRAITTAENELSTLSTVARIVELEEALFRSLSHYMAVGIQKYKEHVNELLANSVFSEYPYREGTYPISSRSILEGVLSTLNVAEENAGVYNAEQYEEIFAQAQNDINMFLGTKIEDGETPDGGEGESEGEADLVAGEVVYVYLSNGNIDAFMLSVLDGNYYEENNKLYFPIKEGDLFYYNKEEYDSCSMVPPALPIMTSFKFNNKFNHNLNVDAEADTVTSNMHFSLNAIGKWLTPSFKLSDDKAVAYVDTIQQVSKESRLSFENTISYKVTYPGYNIVERVKVQDEIWTNPSTDGDTIEIALTADMLYTNKPSHESNEGLDNLLDGNPSTIFHSTWGSANNATVNVNTYITIDLPESLEKLQLYYKCRTNKSGYNPKIWEIYAGNDGNNWTLVGTLDYIADNMPLGGVGQEYTSPTIDLGGSYSKIKILQTSGEYSKNHFVLAELRVYKVLETTEGAEPEKIQDAVYENMRRPFGRVYNVNVDWLTDNAVSVPRIDIDIDGGYFVTSKEYYLNANFRINGYGVYENFEDSVQIKGRGNSSWSQTKKPYRLKFDEKVKPFGLTKGKSWVLLANAQRGSLMANAIAMKIGQMAGTSYVNHIIPVELYMNGKYMGSYMFTEKVGMANNSVDIDEALGYLLEFDTYTDEDIYRLGEYSLPVKVKEPDFDEMSYDSAMVRRTRMFKDVRDMSSAIYNNDNLENVLDVDASARFFLANDFVLNQEINHPKSTFIFKNESDPNGKLTFGPIWDFDWGFGYQNNQSYCYDNATTSIIKRSMDGYEFWEDLTNVEVFKKHYYKVWKEFLENNSMQELYDYIDSYYNFAETSFENNMNEWGYSCGFSQSDAERAKQWLEQRKNYIYNNLTEYNIDDLIFTISGDVNCNNQLTVHDVALIAAYLNGFEHSNFSRTKADCDKNGVIDLYDAYTVADYLLESEAPEVMYWYNTPVAVGELSANAFELEVGAEAVVPINMLCDRTEYYNAIQFDVKVPDGLFVNSISPAAGAHGVDFSYAELGVNTYRIVAFTDDNSDISITDAPFANINLQTFSVIEEAARKIDICNIYAVNSDNDEVRMNDIAILFGAAAGIDDTLATFAISGGENITITALEAMDITVYSVDGRLVRKVRVEEGTTIIDVPAGMYIVNGEKVFVKNKII